MKCLGEDEIGFYPVTGCERPETDAGLVSSTMTPTAGTGPHSGATSQTPESVRNSWAWVVRSQPRAGRQRAGNVPLPPAARRDGRTPASVLRFGGVTSMNSGGHRRWESGPRSGGRTSDGDERNRRPGPDRAGGQSPNPGAVLSVPGVDPGTGWWGEGRRA